MSETHLPSDALRRRVIILFFLGLLAMAILAMGIGWACADWGLIRFGWLNQVLGPVLTVVGLSMYSGIGVWMGSGVVVILTAIVFSVLLTFIYFHETNELTGRFGEEYLQYKRRTPFLLPRFLMRNDAPKS